MKPFAVSRSCLPQWSVALFEMVPFATFGSPRMAAELELLSYVFARRL